jgi:hypothetical protein
MPIKGLTDRGLSFPEIGQIRKGIKETRTRQDGSTYTVPKDLEFFRVEFDQREQESAIKFVQVYGREPKEINIILPFDEIERCWDAWLEAYTAGRMVARSDGERFVYWVDTATGDVKVKNGEPETPYKDGQVVGHDYQGKDVFAVPVGRLKVIIPELARAAFLTVHTTSIHDIDNLSQQLGAFKRLNNGVIKGIPLVLRRRPKKISIPAIDGQRTRMEKWLLSIEADPDWVKAKLVEVKSLALPEAEELLLPEGPVEAEVLDVPETWQQEQPGGPDQGQNQVQEPNMSWELASSIQAADGRLYVDIETPELGRMWGAIVGRINTIANEGQGMEELDDLAIKRDAINVILAARKKQLDQRSED